MAYQRDKNGLIVLGSKEPKKSQTTDKTNDANLEQKETKLIDPMKYSASCIVTDPHGETAKFSNFVVVGVNHNAETAIAFLDLEDFAKALVKLTSMFGEAIEQANPATQQRIMAVYEQGMADLSQRDNK